MHRTINLMTRPLRSTTRYSRLTYQPLNRYLSGGTITPIGGNLISSQSTLFKKLKHYGLHDEAERLGLT